VERRHFEEGLRALAGELDALAVLAVARVEIALQALFDRRPDVAAGVIAGDAELGDRQRALDDLAMKLLALQQPAARDLRLIVSAVKAASDLERIGDHAVNIAQTAIVVADRAANPTETRLREMGEVAGAMLRDAMTAFTTRDAELAREVCARDEEVDSARRDVFRQLLELVRQAPSVTEQSVSLMLVSRNLERIADHATNIAEDAIFLVSARDIRHHAELRNAVEGTAG
jgi:phosphate transport system protein